MMLQFKEDIDTIVPGMLCTNDDSSDLRPLRHSAVTVYEKVMDTLLNLYPENLLDLLSDLSK